VGGSVLYRVEGFWPSEEAALIAARQIVHRCGTEPALGVIWDTSRLDAVGRVRGLLAGAGGDAEFLVADPRSLVARLRSAGFQPQLAERGEFRCIRIVGLERILDALDYAPLATSTRLSIDLGYADEGSHPDDTLVDNLVAEGRGDAIQVHASCGWFGETSALLNGVTVELNGHACRVQGHRPGSHELTLSINNKLDDKQIAARIAAATGRTLTRDQHV
jgi:hypothetical protein